MRVPMRMAGGTFGGAPMEPRNCETVHAVIGSPASRMLIRTISAGSSISRTSRSLRATVEATSPHEVRRLERERHYCRAEPCADDAADTSASDTLRGEDGWKPGTCVTAHMAVVVSH